MKSLTVIKNGLTPERQSAAKIVVTSDVSDGMRKALGSVLTSWPKATIQALKHQAQSRQD